MSPKTLRKGKSQRRGVFILDGGLRLRTPWMPVEIYEKMNICDKCGREGEIYGDHSSINLVWTGASLVCLSCKGTT